MWSRWKFNTLAQVMVWSMVNLEQLQFDCNWLANCTGIYTFPKSRGEKADEAPRTVDVNDNLRPYPLSYIIVYYLLPSACVNQPGRSIQWNLGSRAASWGSNTVTWNLYSREQYTKILLAFVSTICIKRPRYRYLSWNECMRMLASGLGNHSRSKNSHRPVRPINCSTC